jgi:hypothetical protein
MRHRRSLIISLALAPIIWGLTGFGLIVYRAPTRFEREARLGLILGLIALIAAGALLALLVTTHLSPIGPGVAGAAYLVMATWAAIDSASLHRVLPNNLLTYPAEGLATLLGIPLLATALNPHRWRQPEQPEPYAAPATESDEPAYWKSLARDALPTSGPQVHAGEPRYGHPSAYWPLPAHPTLAGPQVYPAQPPYPPAYWPLPAHPPSGATGPQFYPAEPGYPPAYWPTSAYHGQPADWTAPTSGRHAYATATARPTPATAGRHRRDDEPTATDGATAQTGDAAANGPVPGGSAAPAHAADAED